MEGAIHKVSARNGHACGVLLQLTVNYKYTIKICGVTVLFSEQQPKEKACDVCNCE